MTQKEIQAAYAGIIEGLDGGALKPAFDQLQALIAGTQAYAFQNKLNEMEETYRYLLQYYMEGTKDPMRDQIYGTIRAGAYELADQLKHQALAGESPLVYYACRRVIDLQPDETADILRQLQSQYQIDHLAAYEISSSKLFGKLWTTAFLPEADVEAIRGALKDEAFPVAAKCQIVSAFLLGLQVSFDKEKLLLLFDAADSPDEEVKIRACIAICLTLYTYRRRTMCYPAIRHRLETLAETPGFQSILKEIVLRFILSRETEKVTHKLQSEIIPEMIKRNPRRKQDSLWGDLVDFFSDDMNPEWKDLMSNSKFMEKVDEYSRMQEEGMDVMHSTFIHLKHFPFFRDVSSWFLPFTLQYSAFKGTPEIGLSFLEIIMQASYMCNSDKYSLYFGLLQLPIEHRQALVNQMHSQLGDMNRQLAEDLKNKVGKTGNKIGQYIQDLYRFYKLFPRHTEFNDIFNLRLDFHCLPLLTPYLSDTETWTDIAGLYLRKGYFEDAQTIYEQLIACDANNETYYQKRGYCKQMTGDWRGALEDYLRSEMLNPDSKWVIRRIAGCYRALKQPDEALKFYLRYEQQYPGHIPTLIQTGHCYMDLKNYAEALKCYFKADYLDPENHKAERAIAWCSFLIGKYEQAQRYYGKIMDNDPQTQDFINAGHTEWALQNLKQALACYCQAVQSEEEGDFGNFLKLFEQDVPCLVQAGINPQEILLLMDQLRYETVENG